MKLLVTSAATILSLVVQSKSGCAFTLSSSSLPSVSASASFWSPSSSVARLLHATSQNEDVVLFSDDDEDENTSKSSSSSTNKPKKDRWANLNPAIKTRIVKEGQQRAIQNKKKREPAAAKKRRMLMHYKKAMVESKRSSRVHRPLPTNSEERTKLTSLVAGDTYNGTVISLTDFGAYVDIGSECDGLLHVSQITRDTFVEHPRQVLSPGDQVDVQLLRVAPALKKMQLSMLPSNVIEEEKEEEEEMEERIDLDELAIDDELWGEIKRVTHFGAYVELGAVVQGWLHFMDHPDFEYGVKPNEMMKIGDRIRCWVSNVDSDMERIKLTCNRPKDLPGPRREMRKIASNSDDEY